jgi:UDP-N-acetylmuramate dehydrogenase
MSRQISINNLHYDVTNIKGDIKENEPMSLHTTWKVGGKARLYFQPENVQDLQNFLNILNQYQQHHNLLWLGLGSNVLIRDKGYNGIVINTVGKFKKIEFIKNAKDESSINEGNDYLMVSAESGVSCSKFSREMAKVGLLGAEFFSGIPGSMGGAMAMNAGAFGNECWNNLHEVETIDDKGQIYNRKSSDFNVSYRQVEGLKKTENSICEWFLKGIFKYPQNMSKVIESKEKIKKLLEKRNQTQPIQFANAGSVFKNPQGNFAARLIELCGLKNQSIGDAKISQKHANFIINEGSATAEDIELLMRKVQQQVFEKFSIKLEPEIRIYGER